MKLFSPGHKLIHKLIENAEVTVSLALALFITSYYLKGFFDKAMSRNKLLIVVIQILLVEIIHV